MSGEDFVEVKLSAAGQKLASGAAIEIGGGNYHFRFEPGKPQKVTRVLDWERVLSKEMAEGEPMFEVVMPQPRRALRSEADPRVSQADSKPNEEK